VAALSPKAVAALEAELKKLQANAPKRPMAMAPAEEPTIEDARIHIRGSVRSQGEVAPRGFLQVATYGPAPNLPKDQSGRVQLADWIASPGNPLTARVYVNRAWHWLFGAGIVRTVDNFGTTGERPSHPELLDWLAARFISEGWSMKAMHRLMMNSQLYQLASDDNMADVAIDPENRYFWRMPRERVEAEIIRDAIMAVAGTIDAKIGGPNILPYIAPDIVQGSSHRVWAGKPDEDPSTWRRSLYVFSKRSIRYPLFEAYDQPNLINTCDRRNRSTIAPQALMMMNNNFVITQAKQFAARLRKDAGEDAAAQVDRAFLLALGRTPTASEKTESIEYVKGGPQRLVEFCQAMFNLNEFVYRP